MFARFHFESVPKHRTAKNVSNVVKWQNVPPPFPFLFSVLQSHNASAVVTVKRDIKMSGSGAAVQLGVGLALGFSFIKHFQRNNEPKYHFWYILN